MTTFPRNIGKIIGSGFLLFIAVMIILFLVSMVAGTEGVTDVAPADMVPLGLYTAIPIAVVAWLLSLWMKFRSWRDALIGGTGWAVILAGMWIVIAIPNGTTKNMFGVWTMYLSYAAIIIGALLGRHSSPTPKQPTV